MVFTGLAFVPGFASFPSVAETNTPNASSIAHTPSVGSVDGRQLHAPALHVAPVGHAAPHAPQFVGSVCVFTHAPPHSRCPIGQSRQTSCPTGFFGAHPRAHFFSSLVRVEVHV